MRATLSPTPFEPLFLDGTAGRIFAIHHLPRAARTVQHGIVYLPPFAEEMNCSRRMAALQARSLAKVGCGVLLLDPYGCGDSEGDFADARWEIWRSDAMIAVQWMIRRGCDHVSLVGLRLGALLALTAAADPMLPIHRVILWQPVSHGDQMLTRFLRLRLARELPIGGGGSETTRELRRRLAAGDTVEVAGYCLAGPLAGAIDGLRLADLGLACRAPIDWIEVVPKAEHPASPAQRAILDTWQAANIPASLRRVIGDPFWTMQETRLVMPLITTTASLFGEPLG